MSEPKELLRPCVCVFTNHNDEKRTMIKGRFHCWYWSKSKHGKNILLAVVERADGKIKTYLAFEFYFTDNEYWNETESALGAEEIIFPRVEEKQKPTSKKK